MFARGRGPKRAGAELTSEKIKRRKEKQLFRLGVQGGANGSDSHNRTVRRGKERTKNLTSKAEGKN